MPRALQRERTRGGAPAQYEGAPRRKKKKLFGEKRVTQESGQVRDVTEEARHRGKKLIEAARAIQEGRAEAHPLAAQHRLYGPVAGVTEQQARDIGETFADSLIRTYAARQRGKKKKKPKVVPRVPAPQLGDEIARR